jgi:hypothetical protein
MEYAWGCGNSKLGSESRNILTNNNQSDRSSMMYGSDIGFIYYILLVPRTMEEISQEILEISAHCLLCPNELFSLDKSNMVHDVLENNVVHCLNSVSSWCCKLWSPYM